MVQAGRYAAGLRLFAVQKNSTKDDTGGALSRGDLIDVQQGGWVRSTPATVCGSEYDSNRTRFCEAHCGPSAAVPSFKRNTWGYFSAVCYIHGRDLFEVGVPRLQMPLIRSALQHPILERWSRGLWTCDGAEASADHTEPYLNHI